MRSNAVHISPLHSAKRDDQQQQQQSVRCAFSEQWKNSRPFSMNWPKSARRRCTRLEVFLLCLTIALIGLLLGCVLIWLTMFNGYLALRHNLAAWNSNDVVSVATNVAVDSSALHSKYRVCTSRECTTLASLFLSHLDEKVDPCRNMFDFACNNYKKLHDDGSFHSTIGDLQERLHRKLKRLLENEVYNKDKPWDKLSKTFYKKCVDDAQLTKESYKPMTDLLDQIGGWPLLKEEWAEFAGKWEEQLSRVVNQTGITSILMDLSVGFDPENSSKTIIELDQPKFGFEFGYSYVTDEENPAQKLYIQLITDIISQFGRNISEIEDEVQELVELETSLARFSTDETLRNDPHHTNNHFKLKELKDLFPDLDLNVYIRGVFKNSIPISDNDTVIVREVNYFRGVQKLLKSVSKRTIANYISWRILQSYSPFLPRNSRQLFQEYKANLTGEMEESTRWEDCLSLSISLLDMPIGRILADNSFDSEFGQTKAIQIINYLKTAFMDTIKYLDWVGDDTKEQMIRKVRLLAYDLGFPDSIFNDKWMSLYWNYKTEQLNRPLLGLAVQIKQEKTANELHRHKQLVDKKLWYQSPAQVDALYSPNLNKITIPQAIMHFPFLSRVPNYASFAMIGTILSHEISHAFCSYGIKFNPEGNFKTWLDKDTMKRYKDRTECILSQYNKAAKGQRRNGHFYLSENLADNLAIKVAYRAYNLWKDESRENEPILPGFQNFTNEQMFFIAYTNNWCSSSHKINHGDAHASFPLRANIPLQNFEDFSSEFSCASNIEMNPYQKCSVF